MAQENAFLDEFSYCGMLPAIFQTYIGVLCNLSKCRSSINFAGLSLRLPPILLEHC